jgi:hypothetical protein
MGGGGGRGFSWRELEALEKAAKDKIQQASQPEKRSVFISFAGEDLNRVNALRAQAKKEDSELEFVDRSLKEPFDSKNTEYIKRGIRERIRQASVTIVFVGNSTAQSEWVNWEVEESLRQGKGVIAMYSGDNPPATLPDAIQKNKIKVVPWNHETLMKEIERAAKKRAT